jgi:hypothetical protein
VRKFVRNQTPATGDAYKEYAWTGSPNVRARLGQPVTAEALIALIVTEHDADLTATIEMVCCELINLIQAGLVDVVEA